jgi:hypothetical protein
MMGSLPVEMARVGGLRKGRPAAMAVDGRKAKAEDCRIDLLTKAWRGNAVSKRKR